MNEFIVGVLNGIFVGLLIAYVIVLNAGDPEKSEGKFQVVDTYRNCEVIRYVPEGSARYSYFLDCKTP